MTHQPHSAATLFTQVDVAQGSQQEQPGDQQNEGNELLRQILVSQDRQNELIEQLVTQLTTAARQRGSELKHWKQANPELAKKCRGAAETLSQVQAEFLSTLIEEVGSNCEALMDGEFMLNEFVDRFGPRLAHLNGVLQVLTQLSAPNPTNPPNTA